MQNKTTISLVLGSGGARGLAHIGVIHWLSENGFAIRSIAGASMGALVGGIYAAGKLDEYEEWVRAITKIDIVTYLDFSWRKNGLIKGDRIIEEMKGLVGDRKIEDLPIPFTAVATDVKNEKEVWLKSGSLFDAIRASISIPLIFTPFNCNGLCLIDGGVLNPVPIAPTFGDGTDLTIAVNLDGAFENMEIEETAVTEPETASEKTLDIISRHIGNLTGAKKSGGSPDWSAYDILHQSISAMQGTIARQKLAAYPPDHTIEIPGNACGMMEFHRAEEMIRLGYARAREVLSPLAAINDSRADKPA